MVFTIDIDSDSDEDIIAGCLPLLDRRLQRPVDLNECCRKLLERALSFDEKKYSRCVNFITLTHGPRPYTHESWEWDEIETNIMNPKKAEGNVFHCITKKRMINGGQKDPEVIHKMVRNWMTDQPVYYVLVPEYTKQGDIHWHGIIVADSVSKMSKFRNRWKTMFGFTCVSKKFSVDGWIDYIMKDIDITGLSYITNETR